MRQVREVLRLTTAGVALTARFNHAVLLSRLGATAAAIAAIAAVLDGYTARFGPGHVRGCDFTCCAGFPRTPGRLPGTAPHQLGVICLSLSRRL